MNYHELFAKLKARKLFAMIVIIIILSSVVILYLIKDSDNLEFTIEIIENPSDITDKSINYQFKNVDDEKFHLSAPEIGKSFDIFIKSQNGTKYQYGGAGPVTAGPFWWRSLSPGETEEGSIGFGYKMDFPYYLEFKHTNWQDPDTGEYWFFQPGSYKIYGRYESKPNNDFENVLVGIWFSNEVSLTIK